MKKVITYGTYDLLHHGHINLLKRAKELGNYLIVGVTTEDFDFSRGKLNVQQSLAERMEAVRSTGLVDEIISEEYEGQKIDDIRKYNIEIFAIGSDWIWQFDYLNEYCNVVYLPRTQGISSTDLRAKQRSMQIGIIGYNSMVDKFINESKFVNGVQIKAIYSKNKFLEYIPEENANLFINDLDLFLEQVDAVYVITEPIERYTYSKIALEKKKHVLCESPIALRKNEVEELFKIAEQNNCILTEAIKTAYSLAFTRLCLLVKSGIIGEIKSVESTCTSLRNESMNSQMQGWGSLYAWGSIALLPIFRLLGTNYHKKQIISILDEERSKDIFTNIQFVFKRAIASIKVGVGVKSEGHLIVSGTKGYVYVPAPWWKTDYFEVRFENQEENKRYFYSLEGEGIRYEIAAFSKAVQSGIPSYYIDSSVTLQISSVMEDFTQRKDFIVLK